MRRAAVLVPLLLAVACSTRKPSDAAASSAATGIELRGPRGQLLASLVPRGAGYELRVPEAAPVDVSVSASGAEVRDRAGASLAALAPGPAGMTLSTPAARLRVTFARPHGVAHVLDPIGVTLVAIDGATARDAAARVAARVEAPANGPRLVITAGDGARLATVHNLPTHDDTALAALLLATDTIDIPARAALVAYVLSR
jgi:hypothetical protein